MTQLARDIMNREVIAVPVTMDLRDLAKLFLERGITGAPVVDGEGNLAGVISQTDLIYYSLTRGDELILDSHFYQNARVEGHHIPQGFQIEDTNTGTVEDVMTPVVHSVSESASVDTVARTMTRRHIHRVIVCNGRKPAGVISALDVLEALGDARRDGAIPRDARKSASARRAGVRTGARTKAASAKPGRSSAAKTRVAATKARPAARRGKTASR